MVITTTNQIEGSQIEKYLGIVFGEYQMKPPTGLGAALATGFSSLPGTGSSSSMGNYSVLNQIEREAQKLGADAIVGLQFHYFAYSRDLFGVNATGTAVKLLSTNSKMDNKPESMKIDLEDKKAQDLYVSEPEINSIPIFDDQEIGNIDTVYIMEQIEKLNDPLEIYKFVNENKNVFNEALIGEIQKKWTMVRLYGADKDTKKQECLDIIKDYIQNIATAQKGL